jgi:hypothetical protein
MTFPQEVPKLACAQLRKWDSDGNFPLPDASLSTTGTSRKQFIFV